MSIALLKCAPLGVDSKLLMRGFPVMHLTTLKAIPLTYKKVATL